MPPQRRRWDDDRPLRRKKSGNTGLIVGLSLGGAVLLIATILVIAMVVGRKSRTGDDAPGTGDLPNFKKPAGKKTVGHLEESDDPAIVDKVWPRLVGEWEPIDRVDAARITFLPDYRYRSQWTDFRGAPRDDFNPVDVVRDDRGTTNDKTGDCVTVFYAVKNSDGSGRAGGDTINFHPDGTLDISGTRYRRKK